MRLISRRLALTSGLVLGGSAVLGALPALSQDSADNPMPPELRAAIERQGDAPVLGNPEGDITLTEFLDYNCQYCRKLVPVIHKLIAGDGKLRVVFREWPIFGDGSYFAARASLATLPQGKYWAFHSAAMKTRGQANEASVMRVVDQLGLDRARLIRDMDSERVLGHIEHSNALADHMGLAGTPTFIAGNGGLFGDQSLADMQSLIAQARTDLS